MAFKRVLSVFLILLVLISTLCAFKPYEAEKQSLYAVDYPTGTLSVWANGILQNGQCEIGLYGDSLIRTVYGYRELDNYTISFDTMTSPPELDSNSDYYYYMIQVKTYGGCSLYVYGERVSTEVEGRVGYSVSLDIRDYGFVDTVLEIDYEDDTSLPLQTYYFRIIFDDANTISDYDRGYTAGWIAGVNAGQESGYDLGYNAGIEAGRSEGYNDGYSDGQTYSLYQTLTDPIGALLDFTIIPSVHGLPPLTLGGVVLALVGISLVLIFLKYFAGG